MLIRSNVHRRAMSITTTVATRQKYKKVKIPAALREQVWIKSNGPRFQSKCTVNWCKNRINVFDFQCGHRHAESAGGSTTLDNLVPLCARCNLSMGTMHLDEWELLGGRAHRTSWWTRFVNWIKAGG